MFSWSETVYSIHHFKYKAYGETEVEHLNIQVNKLDYLFLASEDHLLVDIKTIETVRQFCFLFLWYLDFFNIFFYILIPGECVVFFIVSYVHTDFRFGAITILDSPSSPFVTCHLIFVSHASPLFIFSKCKSVWWQMQCYYWFLSE